MSSKNTPLCSSRRHGFTLTEVVVVIGIVLFLASILLSLARQLVLHSRKMEVSTQFRQIAIAVFSYAAENGGQLPGPLYSAQGFRFKKGRPEMLFTSIGIYMGQQEPTGQWMVADPSVMTPRQREFFDTIPDDRAEFFRVTVSGNVKPFGYADTGELPMNLNAIESPSEAYMFRELDQLARWASPTNGWFSRIPPEPLHGNVRAISWFDGRVELVPVAETNR